MITNLRKIIDRILWILIIVITFFLSFRFILKLFGANPESPIVFLIYGFSSLFLIPFWNIFPTPEIPETNWEFDSIALIALVFYIFFFSTEMLVMWLSAKIMRRMSGKVEEKF